MSRSLLRNFVGGLAFALIVGCSGFKNDNRFDSDVINEVVLEEKKIYPWEIDEEDVKEVYVDSNVVKKIENLGGEDLTSWIIASREDYNEVIKIFNDPFSAGVYCRNVLQYKSDFLTTFRSDHWNSFKNIHRVKMDDCDGGAIAAAALLSDDGFPPYALFMQSQEFGHMVYLYKRRGYGFGSIGLNFSDINSPKYKTINELVKKISLRSGKNYTKHYILDLEKLPEDYIHSDANISPYPDSLVVTSILSMFDYFGWFGS